MADLFLNPKKKIEQFTPTRLADGRVVNVYGPQIQRNAGQVVGPTVTRNAAVTSPRQTQGWVQAANNFGKAVVSGAQQGAAGVADVALMGGNVLEDVAAQIKGNNEKQRNEINQRYESLRNQIKGAKTVTGESFNPKEDFQFSGNIGRDAATLAGRGLQVGIDATSLINPTNVARAGVQSTLKTAAKTAASRGGIYGGSDAAASGLDTYGSTGDVNKALVQGAKAGAISGVTQGVLEGAGAGIGNARANAKSLPSVKAVLDQSQAVVSSAKLGSDASRLNEKTRQDAINNADPRTMFKRLYDDIKKPVDSYLGVPAVNLSRTTSNASEVAGQARPRVTLAQQAQTTVPQITQANQLSPEVAINPSANPVLAQQLNQEALATAQLAQRPRVSARNRQAAPITEETNNVSLPDELQQVDPELQVNNVTEDIVRAAQERKDRYAAPTVTQRVMEAINPYNAGVKVDREYARSLGVPLRDVPKTQSLEALAERSRNSGQEAEEFLRSSNIGSVVQKYGAETPEANEFNTYRTFMRDLEQRADGRAPLYRDRSDQELAQFINEYEARNPDAQNELRALVQDIENVQNLAIQRGVVDQETVNSARMKKDGGRYEFYTPITRATPENLERASINANGVGNIGRQSIIQDLKGSDIPLDPSFNSITDYVNNAYKQMAKAETSQVFADRVRQGLVPGARFTDTAENAAARKAMRDNQKATGNSKNMNDYAELAADPTTGLQVVSGRQNGSTFRIEVPPEQARFLQGLGEGQLQSLSKLAKATQTPFRTVLTGALNLPFQAISAGYNAIMSPTLSPQGFRVLAPSAVKESLQSVFRNNEFQELLRTNGAQQFTGNLDARQGKYTTAESLAAERDLASKFKFDAKHPGKLWEKLDVPGAKIENAQRTGIARAAFDARLRKGGTEAEAIADAVYSYNNVLPNFGRTSSFVRQLDAFLMYGGASAAGTRSLLTAVKRDPVGVGTRLALTTSALTGLTAASMAQDNAQEFYNDIEDSGKGYLLDNNGIIVLPGAHKVTKEEAFQDNTKKEGEWVGIVKIPLPPELRPVQHAIREQFMANANEQGVPLAEYGQAALDFLTGGARTLANPAVDLVYGLTTNVDRSTGREIVPAELQRKPVEEQLFSTTSEVAKGLAGALNSLTIPGIGKVNVSPLQVDYILSKSGFPGQVSKGIGTEEGPLGAAGESIANRFTNTFGQKEGTKFFNKVDEIAKAVPDNADMQTFQSLHSEDGNAGLLDTAEKAVIYLNRPDVFAAEKKLNDWNKEQGKTGNPLFELPEDQRTVVLSIQANKGVNPGDKAMMDVIEKQNPWLTDYYNKQSEFFDKINAEAKKVGKDITSKVDKDGNATDAGSTVLGLKQPEQTDSVTQKFRVLESLTDSKAKAEYFNNNPDLTDYLAQNEEYNRAKRAYLGLPQLDKYPGTEEQNALQDQYFSIPETDKASRRAFMKANPQLSDFWTAKNIYNLQEAGARARYEGENFDEDAVKDIQSLAKSLGGSGGGFGGKGGGGGSGGSGAVNERKYAVSINAGGDIDKPRVTAKGASKGNARKKITPRGRLAKPKVTSKKSEV